MLLSGGLVELGLSSFFHCDSKTFMDPVDFLYFLSGGAIGERM